MVMSALSNLPVNVGGANGNSANLIWAHNGKNISLVTPITVNNSNTSRQFILGTSDDDTTGFNWDTDIKAIMGSLVKFPILMIGQGSVTTTEALVDDRYTRAIEVTDCPGVPAGSYEIRTAVKVRDVAGQNPQASLMWIADGDQAATLRPLERFYYSFWYYVPSDLNVLTSQTNGNWKTAMEYKTGTSNANGGSGVGDFRFTLVINGDNGYSEWQTKTDNQANGFTASPPIVGPNGEALGVAADDPYWEERGGNNVGINPGNWHFIEVFVNRSASHADLTTGRAIVAVTPYTGSTPGTRVVVCNKTGGVMCGVAALPITRFFLNNCYSSSPLPHQVRQTGWRLWDNMPYRMI